MHANTFAGRMGRWSAQHRKKAIWGWIAFVVIAFVVGNAVGTKAPSHQDYVGQSGYGISMVSPAHIAELAQRAGKWERVLCMDSGWHGLQDVHAFAAR